MTQPSLTQILRQTYRDAAVRDIIEFAGVIVCLGIVYGALWCIFGGGPW